MAKKARAKSSGGSERYYVSGMHCAACEALVERKLRQQKGVRSVRVSLATGEAVIQYAGARPTPSLLNRLFADDGYTFRRRESRAAGKQAGPGLLSSLAIAGVLVAVFLALNRLGLSGLVNVRSGSSLAALFALGLLAGASSCAALVGGIVLSLSKQWASSGVSASAWDQAHPPLLFNAGRLASYALVGTILGAAGSQFQFSPAFTALFALAVSALMLALGLQMLGVKAFARLRLPRLLSGEPKAGDPRRGYMPALTGALTVLLPCGFTLTAEGLAVISGSALRGGLIMLAFALGTMPTLLVIGLAGVRFSSTPRMATRFSQAAGALVVFFALYTANAQLIVLDVWSPSSAVQAAPAVVHYGLGELLPSGQPTVLAEAEAPLAPVDGVAPVVDGKQLLQMDASANGYSPNHFRVRAGLPVRWEIRDVGTSGCTNAVISRRLFAGAVQLTPGETSVVEFTPKAPGRYRFSCWMGMVSGAIEVVEG